MDNEIVKKICEKCKDNEICGHNTSLYCKELTSLLYQNTVGRWYWKGKKEV